MMIEVNGVQYDGFVSANCQINLDSLSNEFSFEAVMTDDQELPFKGGDACKIVVDGEVVLTGNIEIIEDSGDAESHAVTISGRDKTADLLDSTLGAMPDIRGEELSLKVIIENVISYLELDIKVIDEVGPPLFTSAEDLAAPEPGDNAFEFINKYSEKRQVLLTSNSDGNIVIATNSGVNSDGVVQYIRGASDNNTLEYSYRYDTTKRFNSYDVSSGLNLVALNNAGDTDPAAVVNQGGGVFDKEIRPGRRLTILSRSPLSSTECTKRAFWEAVVRKARGLAYFAKVPLFRIDGGKGELWSVNKIYQIVNSSVGKIEPMLCNTVSFSYDADIGSITSLGFVGQNAYTLSLETGAQVEVAKNVT